MKRVKLHFVCLALAVITGGFLRLWQLNTLPFPPNLDELSFGYYGWSILNFGTDEYGNKFPLYFPSIGDYKYPVLAYLNTLPALFFGLSEITARILSALSGIVLIPLVYLLARSLFFSTGIALTAAWLIALTPWSITLSRLGYETNIATTLTTAASVLLLKGRGFKWKIFISFLLLLLSSFCYGAQRIFIPLFLSAFLVISYFKNSSFTYLRKYVFVMFFGLTVVILISFIPWQSRGRASAVIWNGLNAEQENRLAEAYIEAGTSPLKIPVKLTYFFNNKYRLAIVDFVKRYSNYFGTDFLFFKGDASPEQIPEVGELLLVQILFLPLGLLLLFKNPNLRSQSLFILAWLLIAPIAGSLTSGGPYNTRSSIMLPALTIISALGLVGLVNILGKPIFQRSFIAIIAVLVALNSSFVTNQLFIQKPTSKPWTSQQGTKEMALEVYKLRNFYQAVVLPDDQYIFFLFYNKIKPADFLSSASIISEKGPGQWKRVENMGNIYFNMPFKCPKSGKLNVLYVCQGENIPQNSKILKVFRYLDGVPNYTLVEFYSLSKMPSSLPSLPEGLKYMVDVEKNPKFPDGLIPSTYPSFW